MLDIRIMSFLALAKTKNFTRAGELLNLTQPAVSQHIKFLEDYYNVKLIEKKGRFIELTDEGKLMLSYGKEIKSLYDGMEKELKSKAENAKAYNIGASLTIGGYVLPVILSNHKQTYNNIDIKLQVHNTEEILNILLDRKLDLALVEGLFDKEKFNYKFFKEDELVLAVASKSRLAYEKKVDLEDVLCGNLIMREKGSGTRAVFEQKLIELGYDLNEFNPYMELGSIQAIISLVELDMGYTIISKETIKAHLALGTIKILPITNVKILREFNFVYLPSCDKEFIDGFMSFCNSYISS
ncbi:LysR family transcriptional regulator [Clostridium manihotivorum]|uniref:LysR family transcriptional regulator n=1 Tax=Clostridium manihotivorum TaxID=2320868 RepID=A0A3R5QUF9_9CLOT|nr:LysR family transcriptional regulator [Clostridium manihotivorum]QAA32631.1 LysR family transcriptional regulator [Clostridium manihotivorum]